MSEALKSADVRVRIEPELKEDASHVLAECGLTISDAFRLFLRQVVAHRGLPFPVVTPNATTRAAMREARAIKHMRFASSGELFDALETARKRKARKAAAKK